MELNISDLLDDLQDNSVDIRLETDASAGRIKELTMKKIQKESKPKGRRMSALVKAGLAAAIVASLTIPVMAATGFRFTDWLEGREQGYGDGSAANYESWEATEGFWRVALTARDVTGEGMTLSCKEVQDTEVTGRLIMQGGYRLEHWDGTAFQPLVMSAEIPWEASREIRDGDEFEIQINWANVYGSLESGRYRLYKTFTYTFSDGKTVELEEWTEFRIFNEDMAPYIAQCQKALDDLKAQEHYHIQREWYNYYTFVTYTVPVKPTDAGTEEYWKIGNDSLNKETRWRYGEDERSVSGALLRDGDSFGIDGWKGEEVTSGVAAWQYSHFNFAEDRFHLESWYSCFSLEGVENLIGEVWAEENEVGILIQPLSSVHRGYEEWIYRFDDQGRLVEAEIYHLAELNSQEEDRYLTDRMVVLDTSAAQITGVIEAQDVGTPESFSWKEDQARYPAGTSGVRTSGFFNTTPTVIESGYDAYLAALAEYTPYHFNATAVFYDKAETMWKVEIWWENGDAHWLIYLDGNGITRMTVAGAYEE